MKYTESVNAVLSSLRLCTVLCFYCGLTTAAVAEQSVTVGAITQVPPTMIGANTVTRQHLPHHEPWFDQLSIDTLTTTNFTLLRYPGGSLGNKFDWTHGVRKGISPEGRMYLPEHTKVATDATDGKTMWMLNVYDETLTDIVTALKIARDKGVEIKYIELGNEFYFNEIDGLTYQTRFPTGKEYGQEMNVWIATLKAEFPDTQFAVPLTRSPNNDATTRKSRWNGDVDAALTDYDAITIHYYADVSPKNSEKINTYAGFAFDTVVANEQQIQRDYFTNDPDAIKTLLGAVEQGYNAILSHENFWIPNNKNIWFTEFGMRYYPHALKGTWVEALADFTLYQKLLSQPNATIATEQQFVDLAHGSAATYANVGIDVGQELTTTVGALTAEGHLVKAISAMSRDKEIMAALSFSGGSIITPLSGAPYAALSGLVFSDSKSSNAIIANLSSKAQTINTANIGPVGANVTAIKAANFYTFITDDSDVIYTKSILGETLTISPYSIVTIDNINVSIAPKNNSINYTPKFTSARISAAASHNLTHEFDASRYVSDQNENETFTFSLTGLNPQWVSMNSLGKLTFSASGNVMGEAIGSTHEVFVRVVDSKGASDYVTFDVEVVDGAIDTDGDTLVNNDEFLLSLNVLKKDTDGDGVNDNVDDYPLDPLRHSKPVNQSPLWANVDFPLENATTETPYNAQLSSQVSDLEGDTLTFSKVSGPSWLIVNTTGSVNGTPTNSHEGDNSFVVAVSDGVNNAVNATFTIKVTKIPAIVTPPLPATPPVSDTASGGGSMSFFIYFILVLLNIARLRFRVDARH